MLFFLCFLINVKVELVSQAQNRGRCDVSSCPWLQFPGHLASETQIDLAENRHLSVRNAPTPSVWNWLTFVEKRKFLKCFLIKILKSVNLFCWSFIITPLLLETAFYFLLLNFQWFFNKISSTVIPRHGFYLVCVVSWVRRGIFGQDDPTPVLVGPGHTSPGLQHSGGMKASRCSYYGR